MENYWFSLLTSYSVCIAALICLYRYRSMHVAYRPFVWIIWLAAINEIISTMLIHAHRSNAINSNVYILCEALLFITLFYRWSQIGLREKYWLYAFVLFVWSFDNFFWHDIQFFSAPFRVASSMLLCFLAIGQINKQIVDQKLLMNNGRFLISISMLTFYSYKSFFELFYAVPVAMTPLIYQRLFAVLMLINLISNILYALASLCLPKKPEFILRSS